MRRRQFIRFVGTGLVATTIAPVQGAGFTLPASRFLTLLHTNDFHSRIDPFPPGSGRNAHQGGVARRSTLLQRIRSEEEHVLLFDSGDVFQGTPYFNYFAGQLEMQLMERMRYDAITLGNHDFDGGMVNLASALDQVSFPVICSNYQFAGTPMAGRTRDWQVFRKGSLRIGVFGLGIALRGLVPEELYGNTVYEEPMSVANRYARMLRKEKGCDLVVCLSHLGYQYTEDRPSDIRLAEGTEDIDVILGGHTHTFLPEPTRVSNRVGKTVLVNQAGWGGMLLGRLDFRFEGKTVNLQSFNMESVNLESEMG